MSEKIRVLLSEEEVISCGLWDIVSVKIIKLPVRQNKY